MTPISAIAILVRCTDLGEKGIGVFAVGTAIKPNYVLFFCIFCQELIWGCFYFGDRVVSKFERELKGTAKQTHLGETRLSAALLLLQALMQLILPYTILCESWYFLFVLVALRALNVSWLKIRIRQYNKFIECGESVRISRHTKNRIEFLKQHMTAWIVLNGTCSCILVALLGLGNMPQYVMLMLAVGVSVVFSLLDLYSTWPVYRESLNS